MLFSSRIQVMSSAFLPVCIQFNRIRTTERPNLQRTYHNRVCVRALHARRGVHWVGSWYTRKFEGDGKMGVWRGGEGRGRVHAAALIFSPRYATANYSAYTLGPLWICREMVVDYCIRSGAVMSICIMHRLNKRVAVLSDVVEHGSGGGRARKTTIDRRRIPERRSRSARTSKLMYARLFFFFFPPDRSHARDA